ncbi:hypothetical protein GGP41_003807 [Bipolaris sorokiniana]|uniref:Uncharacterized protein n=1 Tax=Cochliobolus sativus TaxID=45130 RepID=A0A8H5ZA47_COCSA|nr:hypothetical protein GGP41_003807 [Bipolaris sorokiniana]
MSDGATQVSIGDLRVTPVSCRLGAYGREEASKQAHQHTSNGRMEGVLQPGDHSVLTFPRTMSGCDAQCGTVGYAAK